MGMPPMTTVTPDGELIRELRESRGLLQIELARQVGLSQQFISRAEGGESVGRLNLAKIALFFGLHLNDLEVQNAA
jgi:transcriptional regulator with XRE-family HTH domain